MSYHWIWIYIINRYMFWTDWKKPSRIERAGMDGKGKRVIVQNLTHPNGLTIDYGTTGRLYWIDTGSYSIESCKLNGKDRKVKGVVYDL